MRASLTCREFVEFLADYREGRLPYARRRTFERHLHGCRACADYLYSYERTRELELLECGDRPLPAEVPEELIQGILATRNS